MKITKRMLQSFIAAVFVLSLGQIGFTNLAPEMPQQKDYYRYKIQVGNNVDTIILSKQLAAHGFDVAGVNLETGLVEVITNDAGVEYVKNLGYKGKVFRPGPFDQAAGPDPRFLNPTSVAKKLSDIHAAYPQLTRVEQVGTSIQGRPVLALLVSSTPAANDARALSKPTLLVDGLHHAREVMTPEVAVDIGETLLKGATSGDAFASSIVATWNIWIIPILNVDGSNIVWTSNNMWRKNAHADQNRVHGVDINRNYAYKWGSCDGSSDWTGAEDYRGKSAASEPETQALMNLAEKIRPTAYLSYHSYSELVLYPYGCNGVLSAQNVLEERMAHELSQLLPRDSGSGNYTPGAPWQILYDVDGDSMDHIHATYGAFAYTFEVNQDFHPPYSLREPTLAKHRNAWGHFLDFSTQNLLTVNVVDGRSNQPSVATVSVDTIVFSQGESPYRTNEAGKLFKVIDPGTYNLTAKLADGRTGSVQVKMAGRPQAVTVTIQ